MFSGSGSGSATCSRRDVAAACEMAAWYWFVAFDAMFGSAFSPIATSAAISHASAFWNDGSPKRSEEHTSELQSLMRISYAVFCLTKKKNRNSLNKAEIHGPLHGKV